MSGSKLTIGMAHFDDFDGLYFTVQALRAYHRDVLGKLGRGQHAELVVIDNSPTTPHGQMVKTFLEGLKPSGLSIVYVPSDDVVGTSATRNKIFEVASNDCVLVLDCHVLLMPGALSALVDQFARGEHEIISGPLVYDDMVHMTTHFDDAWRGEMWGTWGQAWRCPCGPDGSMFGLVQQDAMAVPTLFEPVESIAQAACANCNTMFPRRPWANHEPSYTDDGYLTLGHDPDAPPFEIPGMGLGVFAMRKRFWPGFNRDARGFGGEELYIHAKVRANGGRAICLPALRWVHRFGRPNGVRYPLSRWNKVRNYVLEFQEMGWPLDPIHEHFVASGLMPDLEWERLIRDPVSATEDAPGCGACGQTAERYESLDDAYGVAWSTPRDLDQHLATLRNLAESVDHITEFSGRQESTVAFLAAEPSKLVSHQLEINAMLDRLPENNWGVEWALIPRLWDQVPEIGETDLLFLDQDHTYQAIRQSLDRFGPSVRRWIVLHDTALFGKRGEDGGPGMLRALEDYMGEHREWSVLYHTDKQYGLTILGRDPIDKPKLPSLINMAANLAGAVSRHVADGLTATPADKFEARLAVCNLCSQRNGDRCAACGCTLLKKAAHNSATCPLALWDRTDETLPPMDRDPLEPWPSTRREAIA